MCGICGFLIPNGGFGPDGAETTAVDMAQQLRHRGPDEMGTWTDPAHGLALGHRRLAVQDLTEAGRQPMASGDGRYHVTYNGEIYNFPEIRAKLEDGGVTFRGTSDTEVLLEAVATWGLEETLDRSIGMYAFALWDGEKDRLHLVRDRVGEKPLYYARIGDGVAFASELKALRAHPGFDGSIDREALAAFLKRGYVPAPSSIYTGVRKLEPGTYLTVDAGGDLHGPTVYWDPRDRFRKAQQVPAPSSLDAATDQLEEVLGGATERCMTADVPVGVFLSGGIDSTTITALAQDRHPEPVRTFTIGFEEEGYNEAEYAAAVADHIGTDHTEFYVTDQDALDVVPELPAMFDEPFADSSQIPTHLVSKLAREHVTVALSGDGGDELFGGYTRHFVEQSVFQRTDRIPPSVRHAVSQTLLRASPNGLAWIATPLRFLLSNRIEPARMGEQLHQGAQLLGLEDAEARYDDLTSLWEDPSAALAQDRGAGTVAAPEPPEGIADSAHEMMWRDFVTYLPGDILVKVDRASMATSLETRAPLLNHDVIETAWRLPLGHKVSGGKGKRVLRRVLHRHVPKSLVDRPKTGFAIPVASWLRGELRPWAEDLLAADRLRGQGLLDPATIRNRWQAHLDGEPGHAHALWTVLMFQAWMDEHHPGSRWGQAQRNGD